MTDFGAAYSKTRSHLGSALVAKEAREREVQELTKKLAELTAHKEAVEGPLRAEIETLEAEIQEKLTLAQQDLVASQGAVADIEESMRQIKAAAKDSARNQDLSAIVATQKDEVATSHVDRALEQVRGHISNLDALASLSTPATPSRPVAEDPRAVLERLKAERARNSAPAGSSDDGPSDRAPLRKRTL